jgi:hypothetical protein
VEGAINGGLPASRLRQWLACCRKRNDGRRTKKAPKGLRPRPAYPPLRRFFFLNAARLHIPMEFMSFKEYVGQRATQEGFCCLTARRSRECRASTRSPFPRSGSSAFWPARGPQDGPSRVAASGTMNAGQLTDSTAPNHLPAGIEDTHHEVL